MRHSCLRLCRESRAQVRHLVWRTQNNLFYVAETTGSRRWRHPGPSVWLRWPIINALAQNSPRTLVDQNPPFCRSFKSLDRQLYHWSAWEKIMTTPRVLRHLFWGKKLCFCVFCVRQARAHLHARTHTHTHASIHDTPQMWTRTCKRNQHANYIKWGFLPHEN